MSPAWPLVLAALGAALLGAVLATAFWWWAAPRRLLVRWSAPLRDALDAHFSDQGVQLRLRAQGEKLFARKQHALWRENLEQIHARHETNLLAEIRLLMRSAGLQAAEGRAVPGGAASTGPVRPPTPVRVPVSVSGLVPVPRDTAGTRTDADRTPLQAGTTPPAPRATATRMTDMTDMTDTQLDALPAELPAPHRLRPGARPASPFRPV